MNVVRKDATITNTGDDDAFPGTFEVILSTPAEDRDGEILLSEDWEQPLPDHITFDTDHGMSVASTVGSGVPTINDKGQMVVPGTYSSIPRAQEARTLVNEGHIRTVSVAFLTKTVTKDGRSRKVRELLNGAFVAVPSNREALVTASKSASGMKAGARNSKTDAEHIQAIHDHALALGATPATPADDTGAAEGTVGGKALHVMVATKAVAGSYEQRQQAICDALDAAYPDPPDGGYVYAYPLATFEDSVVFRVSGDTEQRGQWQADYTYDEGKVTLGDPVAVNMVEQVVPLVKSLGLTVPGVTEHGDTDHPTDQADSEPSAAADATAADPAAVKSAAADESTQIDLQLRALATRASALAAS